MSERVEETGEAADGKVKWLTVVGAAHNNLKEIDVHVPLERFVCVTGVSGSGKSSLVNDVLREALARDLNGSEHAQPGKHKRINGKQHLDKVIDIDQSPIGRTPRSNPGTYIKMFDLVRDLFAKLPDSRVRGYKPGRFSFNVPTEKGGGRCEHCEGNGSLRMEMDFLADVWIKCPLCDGNRFNRETLEIRYKEANIARVLEMDVQQALVHFENQPKIRAMLRTLHDVGLDYMKIGQPAPTLSGGEAQRIKLARELVKRATGRTLYLLDEPTTGLHFDDIQKLLDVLQGFVEASNTVLVIEHNLEVAKTADWIIDLGPEGGDGGGRVVATGTPEEVARSEESHTGRALRTVLDGFSDGGGAKPQAATGGTRRKGRSGGGGKLRYIEVTGAQQHNLKNIDVRIPREKITVCAGLSGSGKSSLAIDTIYAEGQRRYVESLSSYARQFLGQLQKPKVEHVTGLSPAISIEQKAPSKSPRSTVGTVTEIYDYLRVLYARIGHPHCPNDGARIGARTADEIVHQLLQLDDGARVLLLAPVERSTGETFAQVFRRAKDNGFRRARVDRVVVGLDGDVHVDHRRHHDMELVVDRIIIRARQRARIADSVEQALSAGRGVMLAQRVGENGDPVGEDLRFSQLFSCLECGTSYEPLGPHNFSANSPLGWCEVCEGLGVQRGTDESVLVPHPDRGLLAGAVANWGEPGPDSLLGRMIAALARHLDFDVGEAFSDLPATRQWAILHGTGDAEIRVDEGLSFEYRGLVPAVDQATRLSWQYRRQLADLVADVPCTGCRGSRIRPDAAAVRLGDKTIGELGRMPLEETLAFFGKLKLDAREKAVAGELLAEVRSRLRFLVDVGVEYLTLDRSAPTLSNGESQRIRLASQVGSGLTGVLYVLDEPTVGLHPRDNRRLIRALNHLRGLGNTVLMVEHDREVIDNADWVLDFGPGAGRDGGRIVAAASPPALRKRAASLTGRYLAGKTAISVPTIRRAGNGKYLTVVGAAQHNLKSIDVEFPLGMLVAVTGVSGSGKSSLVHDILHAALARKLHRAKAAPGRHDKITGLTHVDKVINVNQEPIGNTPSSNPATYTGVFDEMRELFTRMPESRIRGYQSGRFSFNRAGGRCEDCEGMGQKCIQMHFLPDVWVACDTCGGRRYNPETLDVLYKDRNVADVLDMRVTEALSHFEAVPKIHRWLQTLEDVGLGYVQLGQPAPTLSGGEAQRVKLAAELGRPNTGRTIYLLDEPTTGLHFEDLRRLLEVLHRLVDMGNTAVVIEHNLDLIKQADWVIDLGPDAGDAGGHLAGFGTPEQVAETPESHTGRFLADVLAAGPHEERTLFDAEDHAARQLERDSLALADVGKDVKMPWERDGRAWHTRDRVTRRNEQPVWNGDLVEYIVETIEKIPGYGPADWNHRSRVELAPDVKGGKWLLHLFTADKWMVNARFRVPPKTFSQAELSGRLGIKKLDDLPDLPIYGQWSRVRVRHTGRELDEVHIWIVNKQEIDTPAFRKFIKQAATALLDHARAAAADKKTGKPWTVDGRKWHLARQGMARRHAAKWQPNLLVQAMGLIQKAVPNLEIDWNNKTYVGLHDAEVRKPWCRLVTTATYGLQLLIDARPAHYNRAAIEGLARWDEIKANRTGPDRIRLIWQRIEDTDAPRLASFLKECHAGWRECVKTS